MNRMLSLLLALVLLFTFSLPVSAAMVEPVRDAVSVTGGSSASEPEPETSDPAEETTLPEDSPESEDDPPPDMEDADPTEEKSPAEEEQDATEPTVPAAALSAVAAPTNTDTFVVDCTPEQAERFIDFYEYVKTLIDRPSNPRLRTADGDSGNVSWVWGESVNMDFPSGDPGNPYHINNIPRITLSTADAPLGRPFCAEFGPDPGGSYTASEGSDSTVLGILVAFQNGDASAVGVQLALWYIFDGLPVSGHPQAAAALSAGRSADTTGYTYYEWNGSGQPFVTLDNASEEPPTDSTDPGVEPPTDPPTEPTNPNTTTEVTTDTKTRTEIRSNTEYEYSDAIGQITVTKRDHQGVSLDGAIFRIDIEFANGERGGDSAFEVYNGSRLFTYTHPRDDHDPAKITVTEVRAPDGYTGDSTPQTAIVHPTYTRVTKVTTHTITITTTTTTTSVIDIDTGEVLAESSASADAETELDPPVIQEYVDFVEGDRETTMTFVNRPKPSTLTIYKHEKGNYPVFLPGARFRIRYADPNVSAQVWTLTTGADGMIHIDLPYAGTLIIEELEAPAGYVIGQTSMWEVTVAKGEDKRIDISNDKKAHIIAYKKDAQTGQLLAGAIIKATLLRAHTAPYNQNASYTATTNANGEAIFSNMIPGEYRIEEQSPPQYYLGTTVVHTVSVFDGSNEPVTVTFENQPWTGLTIRKVDATNGEGLKGAVFELFEGTAAENTKFLGDFISNENGVVVIQNLESNKYYTIVESQPPYGYFLDEDQNVQTIMVKPDAIDENLTVVFRNKPRPKLLITKIDETTGLPLSGAVFRVAVRGGSEYVEVTTGPDGSVLLENMLESWYQVTEIRAPSGYLVSDEVHDIELVSGETAKLIVKNHKEPTLVIEKYDEATNRPLAGAVFRVAPRDGGDYIDVTTDEQGAAVVTGLKADWYSVTEIRSPSGYLPITEPQIVQLEPGKTTTIKIANQKEPALIITKVDAETGAILPGAVFRIAPKDGGDYIEVTTDAHGVVKVDGLKADWYSVTEIRSPSGYLLLEEPQIVELVPGEDTTLRISNHKKPSLTITKIDEATGEKLSGAVLRVTKDSAQEYQDVTTDASGRAVITDLAPGWVTVVEIKAPGGYLLDETPHHIQLNPGEDAEIIIKNRHKPSLLIVKLDSVTKQPLQYVTFKIAYKNGKVLGEYTTNEGGEIYLEDIDPGLLVITETKSRPGYRIDSREKEALVEWGKVVTVEFFNAPINPLLIRKIDAVTGEPLPDAVFSVSRVNGAYVGEYTTGHNGFITVTGVDPGFYVVKEIKSPRGYILNDTPKNVELKLNQPAEVTFENKPLNSIQIHKIDADTREPLEGVRFVVRKKNGSVVGEFVTDANGLIEVPNLEPGWYQIAEKTALPGYLLDSHVRDVEVVWNDHVLLEFTNTKLSGLQVRKLDSVTKELLQGVKFRVTKMNGEFVGDYVTGPGGFFAVEDLELGWFTAFETATIPGYVLDATPQNVLIEKGELAVLDFENKPLSGLQIRKVDAVTRQPLAGVEFKVAELNGRLVGDYTSDEAGIVFVPDLREGFYVVTEVKGVPGYKPDYTPRNVEIVTGELNVVEYRNQPYPVLLYKGYM